MCGCTLPQLSARLRVNLSFMPVPISQILLLAFGNPVKCAASQTNTEDVADFKVNWSPDW